ncbi:30S ribosomal protein S4 [Wolbachia endosymbiont of Dirofilaria (Dirofilaria) immitis]|uniref:30S ribosomal protein S4 n=1 Tax=Wolbachia endosymbiont of Dirofilaria (Dirofilaria) immitis TaxID=1812115 RepID=UPI00158E2CA6|nr:30S ribosomal protein S4 [Wolbachia endosymbiont of Dirofilaria (Dirofilaria) immitis]QKX02364.1 30S ribosomal protein S4 [Wolbachia endosymbiont of Dirofilaria (Dirofilaria) immitis]
MTTIISRKYRISRRLGVNLWGRVKDPVNKRKYPPGQHGILGFKRLSDFGKQFAAHKKFKFYYAISSKQLRRIFLDAYNRKGYTADNFIGILESRLSAILYHSGLVPTIYSAKQLISHKHVTVNGRVVNISSYRVRPGDIVRIRESAVKIPIVIETTEKQERKAPGYLEINSKEYSVKYLRVPQYSEVPYSANMEVNLVVEFYSR